MLTVSELARLQGISKQAIYKQLQGKYAQYKIVKNGKTFIDESILNEVETKVEKVEQPTNQLDNQPTTNQVDNQLKSDKDFLMKEIERLHQEIDELRAENKRKETKIHELYESFLKANKEHDTQIHELIAQQNKLIQSMNYKAISENITTVLTDSEQKPSEQKPTNKIRDVIKGFRKLF